MQKNNISVGTILDGERNVMKLLRYTVLHIYYVLYAMIFHEEVSILAGEAVTIYNKKLSYKIN